MNKLKILGIVMVLSIIFGACGKTDDEATDLDKKSETVTNIEKAKPGDCSAKKTGFLYMGYFFSQDGISASSTDKVKRTAWEIPDFEYLCMNPVCQHKDDSCSAFLQEGLEEAFAVIYESNMYFFEGTTETEFIEKKDWDQYLTEEALEGIEVNTEDIKHISVERKKVQVYKADKDGKNRKKILEFQGCFENVIDNTALLCENKVYLAGEKFNISYSTENEQFIMAKDGIFVIDLKEETVEEYTEIRNINTRYTYKTFYDDNRVIIVGYCTYESEEVIHNVYIIDLKKNKCEFVFNIENIDFYFYGIIENNIYYEKNGSLYKYDIDNKEEEEIYVPGNGICSVSVIDGKIYILKESSFWSESEIEYSKFSVYDKDMTFIKDIELSVDMFGLQRLGDKIIYLDGTENNLYYIKVENVEEIKKEESLLIGSFFGYDFGESEE